MPSNWRLRELSCVGSMSSWNASNCFCPGQGRGQPCSVSPLPLAFLCAQFPSPPSSSFVPGLSRASCRSLRPSFTCGSHGEGALAGVQCSWAKPHRAAAEGERDVAARGGGLWAPGLRPCLVTGRLPAGGSLPRNTPENFLEPHCRRLGGRLEPCLSPGCSEAPQTFPPTSVPPAAEPCGRVPCGPAGRARGRGQGRRCPPLAART